MNSASGAPASPGAAGRWRLALALAWLAGGCGFALLPAWQQRLGFAEVGMWFADSYAVLAAVDTVRAGADPTAPMAADPFQRPHVYSDWWLALGRLGFDRGDNFLIGGAWVAGFAAAVLLLLRPRDGPQVLLCLLLLLSPPVLLAVHRANNDLPIFVGLAGIAALAVRPNLALPSLGVLLVGLVTGLRYYPAVAAAAFLVVRPPRRMASLALAAGALAGLALVDVWPAVARGMFRVPNLIHSSGGGLIWRNFSWEGGWIAPLNAAVLLAGGFWLWRSGRAIPAATLRASGWTGVAFVIGAAVSVTCFAVGVSHSYRLIHLLLVLPCLLAATGTTRAPGFSRVVPTLITIVLWSDGLIALVGSTLLPPISADTARAIIVHSRWVTQPPAWILMAWLTACLIGVVRDAIKELRA